MSQVLSTFRSAFGTAVRSPMHLTVVLVVGTAAALASVVVPLLPVVGLLAGPLFNAVILAPLVLAALLGSAHAVRNGQNAWNGAQSAVDDHWTDLVGAYGIVAVVWIFVGGALGMVFVLGAVGVESVTEFRNFRQGTQALVVALPALSVLALFALASMVLQFVAPAAVVADTDAVESLRTAIRFSVANPFGVLGFSLVAIVVAVAASLPGIAAGAVAWQFGHRIAAAVILVIGSLEAATVAGSITSIYLVEYFAATADASVLPEGQRQVEPAVSVEAGVERTADTAAASETSGFEFGEKNETERL